MAYATIYRVESDTLAGDKVKIDIQQDGFVGSVTNLEGSKIKLTRPDGDFDKFAGVRKSNLTFEVFITQTITPELFFTTSDIEFKVILYINDVVNWYGWLDSGGFAFKLLDYGYNMSLRANDGLSLLENSKFADLVGDELFGQYKPTQVIGYCLASTELQLNFNTWIDIYPTTYPVRGAGGDTTGANDPLNSIYIDTGTFRNGVNEYDTPLVILEKICQSFKMTLFQAKGEWHFVYVEDWIRNAGLTGTKFSYTATALSYTSNEFNEVVTGLTQIRNVANADANVSITPNYKAARLDYSFDVPRVKIKNQDFSTVDETTLTILLSYPTYTYKRYDLEGWTFTGQQPYVLQRNFGTSDPQDNETYWLQFFDSSNSSTISTVQSANILVSAGDSFNFSCEAGISDATLHRKMNVFLSFTVTNGVSTYYLKADGKWGTTVANVPNLINATDPTLYTMNNPRKYEFVTAAPIPITGNMIIGISCNEDEFGTPLNSLLAFVKKIDLEYTASVGYGKRRDGGIGTRQIPAGQYYESNEDLKAVKKLQSEVFVSNSPNITTQGAIMNTSLVAIKTWKHTGVTETISLGQMITRAVWKGIYRPYYKVECNLLNVVESNYLLSNLNIVVMDEFPNKKFMITTIETDISNCRAEATLLEIVDETNTNDFDELATNEFSKYNSDISGKLFAYNPRTFRNPSDYLFGPIGFLFDGIFNNKRRR